MLRSKAAWALSRPGSRWRLFGGPVSVVNVGTWRSFKYQGGYYLGLSTSGPVSWIHISENLTHWSTFFILRALTDIACDGTNLFCTSDNNFFGAPGVVKSHILAPTLLSDYGIGAGLVTKTIDWSPGVGKFIIGVTGGILYNTNSGGTTWSAPLSLVGTSSVPIKGITTAAGVYGLIAEDPTPISGGVEIKTINSSLAHSGFAHISGTLNYSTPGAVYIPGTRAPLYVFRENNEATKVTRLITQAPAIIAPPTTPLPISGLSSAFTIPYTSEKLINIFNSPDSGTIYVGFESGQVWQTNNYGVSWSTAFSVPAGTRLAVTGPKGIAIGYPNGYILASPSPLQTI